MAEPYSTPLQFIRLAFALALHRMWYGVLVH
jgi:hypothetical protein